MTKQITVTLSTPVGGELASLTGTVEQIRDTITNWLETAEHGDTIRITDADSVDDDTNIVKPEWGSQQWAEARGDDIPSYDELGDEFDA